MDEVKEEEKAALQDNAQAMAAPERAGGARKCRHDDSRRHVQDIQARVDQQEPPQRARLLCHVLLSPGCATPGNPTPFQPSSNFLGFLLDPAARVML